MEDNNIIEQQCHTEALKTCENRFQALVETIPHGIQENDPDGIITFSNKAHHRILGYAHGELIGKAIWDFQPTDGDRIKLRQYLKELLKVQLVPSPYITRNTRKDGSIVDFQVDWDYKRDERGQVTGFISVITDITARKQTEEALQRAKDHLQALSNASPDMIFLHSSDGRLIDVNENVLRNYGYSIEEMLSADPEKFMGTGYSLEMAMERVKRALTEGFLEFDWVARRRNGEEFPVEVRLRRLELADNYGKCKPHVVAVIRDVSELRRVNRKLHEINESLEAIIKASPDAVMALDPDGKMTLWNEAAERIFGWSEEEVMGRPNPVVPAGKEAEFRGLLQRVLKGETFSGIEIVRQRKDGSLIDVSLSAAPLHNAEGAVTGVMATLSDITARKRNEEKIKMEHRELFSIFDSIDEIIYVADPKTHEVLFVNKALREQFGDTVGQKCHRVFQNLDDPCSFCTNKYILNENEGKTYVWEFQNNINKRWYRCIDRAIGWPDGRMVRYEMAVDITERERMREELIKAQKLESVGLLAGGLAHDFNNLLTAILGNVSLARLTPDDSSKVIARLEEAETALMRAKDLTFQLLTFAKGGSPVKKTANIGTLIKDTVKFSQSGSSVRAVFMLPDDIWQVDIDEGQISQVINNLIINASQAMPQGGTVRISCDNVSLDDRSLLPIQAGNYVKITIEDQGTGIPAEYLDKIFDPYFTTKQTGSGLGLSTSYSIIGKHGGHISVESRLGVGTSFYIYLPASEKAVSGRQSLEGTLIKGNGKILVMDDEALIRDMIGEMLRSLGYEVEDSKNGDEAFESYRRALESKQPFDLIILDLTIPGGPGGAETLQKIRNSDPAVRAIVSSGYSHDPVMAEYEKFGFKGILRKPFNIMNLSETVHAVLQGRFS